MAASGATEGTRASPWGRLVPVEADHAQLDMFEEEYTIGRSKRCSLRLSDLRVSGVHCRIRREGSTVTIVDKSTNGTFVNGKRQRKDVPRQLHNGDTITLSQAEPDTSENKAMGAYMFYDFEHRPVAPPEAKHRVDITSLYELRDELGRGTFGTVYLARRRSTGEEVAVKMVRKRKLQQQAYSMSEVEAEARMMVRMQHPYLAKLQGSWHDRDHIYLVMDLYRGGELFTRIVDGKGAYDEAQARTITLRLLLALQFLHEHNVAHRDLKPENVMIATAGGDDTDVRIVDFGGAKQLRGSGYRSYVGSLQYMAPEVVSRKGSVLKQGRYDQGCDMWSMGIIVYVLLSAYTPFTGDSVEKTGGSVKWAFAPADKWAAVSAECKDMVRKLLDPDPTERLTADEALMHPWLHAQYREWSLANPGHASKHAKLTFLADDAAGAAGGEAAAAAAEGSAAPLRGPKAAGQAPKRGREDEEDEEGDGPSSKRVTPDDAP